MPVTSSSTAPSGRTPGQCQIIRFPVFATKAALLLAIEGCIQGGRDAILDVLERLSNTDTSATGDGVNVDKGSYYT